MLNSRVLVLNRSYLPIHLTSARRALTLVYSGTANVVDEHYETFDFSAWARRQGGAPLPGLYRFRDEFLEIIYRKSLDQR